MTEPIFAADDDAVRQRHRSAERRSTVSSLVHEGMTLLAAAGVPSARLDAELLLAEAVGGDRTMIHTRPDAVVPDAAERAYTRMLERRAAREPLAYVVGRKEFWSLDFEVTPAVLIPRPETEIAVEVGLDLLRALPSERPSVCDLGTGSGCIAVAIARELPQVSIVAVDVSTAALEVAARNVNRHGVGDRVELVASDLFSAIRGRRFDLVIANPPYAAVEEIGGLEPELHWEPEGALNGGPGGLAVLRRLLAGVAEVLVPGGWLVMEIGAEQGAAALASAAANAFAEVRIRDDYAGKPRVLVARVS